MPAGARATSVALRAGSRVDQLSLTLDERHHAHPRRHRRHRVLADPRQRGVPHRRRTCAKAQKDGHTRIFYARFTTSLGRTLAGGTTTSDCVTRTAPSGWQIAGFHGRSGDEVDKVGLIYTQR